jgi:hypothetical protein
MKKTFFLLYSLLIGVTSFADRSRNINEKLLQSFRERFPNAEQIVWNELADTYVVNFVEDGIRSHITYRKDGEFVSASRYYLEQNLPYYLVINIKKKYPGKKIYGVTEISSASGIEYYIKLEDARIWMTLESDSRGDLHVVEKFRKAS